MLTIADKYLGQHICTYLPYSKMITINSYLRNKVQEIAKYSVIRLQIVVVGMRFQPYRHFFSIHDFLTLRREPTNKVDNHAVAVYLDNQTRVAYLRKQDARDIEKYLGSLTHVSLELKKNYRDSSLFDCMIIYPNFYTNH